MQLHVDEGLLVEVDADARAHMAPRIIASEHLAQLAVTALVAFGPAEIDRERLQPIARRRARRLKQGFQPEVAKRDADAIARLGVGCVQEVSLMEAGKRECHRGGLRLARRSSLAG